MFDLNAPKLHTVLCLGAHPDDIEIGCGGTLLEMLAANPSLRIIWVVLSSEGCRKPEAEASFHAWCQGRKDCELLLFDFPDTLFPWHGVAIKQAIHEIAEMHSPDAVFTHHRHDAHQDHRIVAELTWNAFRNHLIFEYEIPKLEGDLGHPNVFVPLSKNHADRKIDLLMTHFSSQRDKPWFQADTFWALMHLRGIEAKTKTAEAFHAPKVSLSFNQSL